MEIFLNIIYLTDSIDLTNHQSIHYTIAKRICRFIDESKIYIKPSTDHFNEQDFFNNSLLMNFS